MSSGVVKRYSKTVIDNKTAGQIAVLDAYGRRHGLSFIVVDSIGEGEAKVNGAYIGKNRILVSLNAEGGALLSVAGHEVYHYIAKNNKVGAESIKAFVLDKLKNYADYDYSYEFARLSEKYGTDDTATIEEEMVANAMFELLSNENVINDLARENPSLLEKIITAIKNFIAELRKMAKSLPWKEIAVFEEDIQSLETIRAMAETALWNIKEINEHKRIVEQKTGASENTKVNKTRENVKTASAENNESEENVKEENNTVTFLQKLSSHSDDSAVEYSIRLSENDLNDYLNAGSRKNKNKISAIQNNHKILLTSEDEIVDFINDSINNQKTSITVAYGKVNDRLALDVYEYSNGSIDINNNYIELIPNNIHHAFEEHQKAKEAGDIDLSEEDFEKIPEYLDTYDELVYAIKFASGNTRICVSKKLQNGRILIIETVSKSRGSIQFKNAIGVTEEKYINEYISKYKKGSGKNTRGNNSSNISLRDLTTSKNSLSQNDKTVNNQYMQNSENDTIKLSFAGTKAKTANYTRLDEAIRLEDVGKASDEEIRQQTGWFRSYDNKWRFEIDDSKMEFSRKGFFTNPDVLRYHELADKFLYGEISDEENRELQALKKSLEGVKLRPETLGDYVKHDELFKAYPELKNLKVTLRSDMPTEDHGSYDSQKKEIELNSFWAKFEDAFTYTLIHEIQHAIQDIEGFSGGTSPEYWARVSDDMKPGTYEYMMKKRSEIGERILSTGSPEFVQAFREYNRGDIEYRDVERIATEDEAELLWDYDEADRSAQYLKEHPRTNENLYRNTAGEIEAQDTSRRLGYDAEKRKNTRPDIDRTDVVFAKSSINYSSDETIFDSFGIKKKGDYIHVQQQVYNTLLAEGFFSDKNGKSRTIENKSSGMLVEIKKSGINETFNADNYARHSKVLKTAKLATIRHLPEIIEKGKIIADDVENNHNKNSSVKYAYLESVVSINDNEITVKVAIRKSVEKNKFWVHSVDIKNNTESKEASERNISDPALTTFGVNESISQQNDNVNIKLSLQETAKAGETREQLLKENANLRVANKLLKSEMQLTKGNVLPYETAKQIARNLMKEYSSEYNSNDLAMEIYQIFDYYDGTGDYDYVMNYLATVGKRVEICLITDCLCYIIIKSYFIV